MVTIRPNSHPPSFLFNPTPPINSPSAQTHGRMELSLSLIMMNNEGMTNIHSSEAAAARSSVPLAFLTRTVVRVSRARWFGFLRRVFQYQNGSRSDLGANPFNSKPWLALELAALVVQMVGIALVLAVSKKERPVWPVRIWVSGYNLGNFLSLPLLYWRYLHCRQNISGAGSDLEQQQRTTTQESRNSYLMNKSRTFLELFYAIWFVMGNVWVFDARYGNFRRAPRLHALCVALLAWNAITYSFPFLLFLLLCCCVPIISNALGYNMNVASAARGASDHEISSLTHWKFKAAVLDTSKDHGRGSHENSECCICLAKYRDKEEVRQLPCSHVFHQGCVDQWLRIISCCPLCKKELSK